MGGGDGISRDDRRRHIKIDDILLLFIYLELGAMVGIYFKTNHMPVRFLIYVAITALTRLLISNVSHHNPPDMGIIYLCGGILLLAFSILVVRYASSQFPSVKIEKPQRKLGAGSGEHPEDREGRALKPSRSAESWLLTFAGGGGVQPAAAGHRFEDRQGAVALFDGDAELNALHQRA